MKNPVVVFGIVLIVQTSLFLMLMNSINAEFYVKYVILGIMITNLVLFVRYLIAKLSEFHTDE